MSPPYETALAVPKYSSHVRSPESGTRKKNGHFVSDAKNFADAHKEMTTAVPEESFYFLNIGMLRERARLFINTFIPDLLNRRIAYAVKANPNETVLETLFREGLHSFDCASINEICAVKKIRSDVDALFNHPVKKRKDIAEAARLGTKHFTAQSSAEVQKILDATSGIQSEEELEIAIRMQTNYQSADINLSEKFGTSPEEVLKILRETREISGSKLGISMHTGSQNRDPKVFVQAIQDLSDGIPLLGTLNTINLGGGIPANYFKTDQYKAKEYLEAISSSIRKLIRDHELYETTFIIEPGRSMVAESVDLTIPILAVDIKNGKNVAYIDDGIFTSFSDHTIHNWKYPLHIIPKPGKKLSVKTKPFRIFGRTCDSGDCLGIQELPENLDEGDTIHVPSAGAYHSSQASHFNGFEPHQYVIYNS